MDASLVAGCPVCGLEASVTGTRTLADAHQMLLDLFNQVDPSPAQIRLTALAASAAGDAGDAYYYMSLYDLADGQLALANQQLEMALSTPELTNVQRLRFRAFSRRPLSNALMQEVPTDCRILVFPGAARAFRTTCIWGIHSRWSLLL